MAENYDLIFGQGASSQYAWSDSDYQNGWKTVGSTPPTAEQFDALQRRSDTKAKDLNNRLSPLETTASKALARVTPAANRLPYFNSSNSATTTAISDFIKTLLDDGNAATARATLGAPSTTGGGASGTWGINISGNAKTATTATTANTATNASSADSATKADKLASESGSNYLYIDNTTEDSWSVIGSNPGSWLKSIGTDSGAPPYSIGNYSAAVAFGIYGTKGIITHAYDKPRVKFAGGNGSTANWKFTIQGGSNNEVYNLNNFPTKTGGGASGTWGINISGNAASADSATDADKVDGVHAASLFYNKGNWDADNWATMGAYEVDHNPPVSDAYGWGQVISSSTNSFCFQLYAAHIYEGNGRLHYRTGHGDNKQPWNTILDSENYNNYAPTKTGDGASGTWGIDISGNAASATTAGNVSGKIYYSSDSPSVATDKLFTVKQARQGDDNAPNNGLVIQTGPGAKYNGKLFITDNGKDGVWIGGRYNGEEVDWTRLVENKGTWGIDISGNAASATNADKLDGAHLADVYRQVGGHNTPTITSIIDWDTMKACNGGTDVRSINNTTYGVRAYGGDNNFSSGVLNGYAHGSFYLTQDFTNFDKLCFLFCSDEGEDIEYTMTDVFLLNYIMTNYSAVNLSHDDNDFWVVTGYSNKGTGKDKVSTKRIFSAQSQNCGLIDVLGIKY